MGNKNNDQNLIEKLKQALSSTVRVISDDFNIKENNKVDKSSKKFDCFREILPDKK